MASIPSPATTAGRVVEALRSRAGPAASERTLAVLMAIPHGTALRSVVDAEVSNAGGRVVVRGEALVALFTAVSHALACATALMRAATEPPSQLGIGIDHREVPLDASNHPAAGAVDDAAAMAGIALAGQVLVSDRVVPHLSDARTARIAKMPRAVGEALLVYEVAWHPKQRIGRRAPSPGIVVASAVGLAVLGVLGAHQLDVFNADAEDRRKMMVELPLPRPDAGTVPAPEEVPAPARPARRQGTLTLLTTPTASVKLKGKALGSTPLFNLGLDVGIHVLELTGPDGRVRVLSAPIRNGENTAFRLKLDELPVR